MNACYMNDETAIIGALQALSSLLISTAAAPKKVCTLENVKALIESGTRRSGWTRRVASKATVMLTVVL